MSATSPHTALSNQAAGNARDIATQAMGLMVKYAILPTPENYTVWYAYVVGENLSLCREIDKIREQHKKIPQSINNYLFMQHIAPSIGAKEGEEDPTEQARDIMSNLTRMIQDVGQETSGYGKELDNYARELSEDFKEGPLKEAVEILIDKTRTLSDKGALLNEQLSASQEEVERLKTELEVATQASRTDYLTGLLNRKSFDVDMERLVNEYVPSESSGISLLMLDIDHFKKFNDTYGHLIGDEVIKTVARTLKDCVRGKDIPARYGGEEFAVILPDTPIQGASVVAENIRKNIAARTLKRKDNGASYGNISVSIGVSVYRYGEDNIDSFIERADDALYTSKEKGRNRVTIAD